MRRAVLLAAIVAVVALVPPSKAQSWPRVLETQHRVVPSITPGLWFVPADPIDIELALTACVLSPQSGFPTANEIATLADPTAQPRWLALDPSRAAPTRFACALVTSERADVRMARVVGAEQLFVNGEAFVGDSERRGFQGVPVHLRAGVNHLVLAGIRGPFEVELWKPATGMVVGTWDVVWPGSGAFGEDEVSYPIFNAMTESVAQLHLHYGHETPEGGDCEPRCPEWRDTFLSGGVIPPLAMRLDGNYWTSFDQPNCHGGPNARFTVGAVSVWSEHVANVTWAGAEADNQLLRKPIVAPPPEERPWAKRNSATLDSGFLRELGDRFVLVVGTGGTDDDAAATLARARFDQQWLWYHARLAPQILTDRQCLRALAGGAEREAQALHFVIAERRLVFYGNRETNAAWAQRVPVEAEVSALPAELVPARSSTFGWFFFRQSDEPRDRDLAMVHSDARAARAACLAGGWPRGMLDELQAFERLEPSAAAGREPFESRPK